MYTKNSEYLFPEFAKISKIFRSVGFISFVIAVALSFFGSGHFSFAVLSFVALITGSKGVSFSLKDYYANKKRDRETSILLDNSKLFVSMLLPALVIMFDEKVLMGSFLYKIAFILSYFVVFSYINLFLLYIKHNP